MGAWVYVVHPTGQQAAGALVTVAGSLAYDQVGFGGGMEALVLDTIAQKTNPAYRSRQGLC